MKIHEFSYLKLLAGQPAFVWYNALFSKECNFLNGRKLFSNPRILAKRFLSQCSTEPGLSHISKRY